MLLDPILAAYYPRGMRSVHLTHPLSGNAPHTLKVLMSYPTYEQGPGPWSDHRLWLMRMGQEGPGSEHWIVSNDPKTPLQFGVFCGEQIHETREILRDTHNLPLTLLAVFDGTDYTLYCEGTLIGKKPMVFNFTDSTLKLGQAAKLDGIDFDGLIYHVELWERALSESEIQATVRNQTKNYERYVKAMRFRFVTAEESSDEDSSPRNVVVENSPEVKSVEDSPT